MVRSRDSKARFLKILGAGLVLFLALAFSKPVAPYARALAANLFAPRAADTELAALSKDALIARVKSDEAALSGVKYQTVLYASLVAENAKLRNLLNAPHAADALVARVVSRPPETLYDTLLIDQGSAAGVKEGNLVEYEGIALGRVTSVGQGTAVVKLFSSPGDETDALLGTPGAIAVAKGMGGGAFELSVPQGVTLAVGDAVGANASHALLLGTVSGISAKPSDASQTVYVRSPVSLSDLDFIEIVPGTP
jgi:cell shape-determining protein MreC